MTGPTLWSPGNVHDIEAAVIILAGIPFLSFLKKQRFGSFWKKAYTIFSLFFFFGFLFGMAFYAPALGHMNILLVRVFQNIHPNYGHWLTWLAVIIVYARFGWKDVFKGSFMAGVLVAFHEWLWYISYFTVHTIRVDAVVLYYYWPFLFLISAMLAMYFIHVRALPKRKIFELLLVLIVYYALWIAAGFPLTLDNITGVTPFYYSLTVNFIEDASWLVPAMVMIV